MRHLLQSVDRLAASGSSSGVVHTDTFLILAAVLCFLFCVVGLAFVARCWRLCNPSAYSVDAQEPESSSSAIMPPSKGLKKKALQALPTVLLGGKEEREEEDRPECAICLAEFARGDEVRVLPPCAHRFHAACVDVWLLSSSTCPSCRRALVVVMPAAKDPTPEAYTVHVAGERGPCRTSVP
ncbi:hypothetical protein PR202_ga16600 [Eleusine coracana subsp. coracana]|uniref:RING-type domain-containing protein n=1 Tax=Eleusine coracana subsp. coracana TaxID=191504 RepID=A0AAV5CN98_ELECO|nr:hypothetical protein QOZ80_6AG0526570 [Eleusine coracana subsp. coracana]GJM99497.1 hypothetical protein PR202_ga16600 [Eleusine coracana subsp. coracana]